MCLNGWNSSASVPCRVLVCSTFYLMPFLHFTPWHRLRVFHIVLPCLRHFEWVYTVSSCSSSDLLSSQSFSCLCEAYFINCPFWNTSKEQHPIILIFKNKFHFACRGPVLHILDVWKNYCQSTIVIIYTVLLTSVMYLLQGQCSQQMCYSSALVKEGKSVHLEESREMSYLWMNPLWFPHSNLRWRLKKMNDTFAVQFSTLVKVIWQPSLWKSRW